MVIGISNSIISEYHGLSASMRLRCKSPKYYRKGNPLCSVTADSYTYTGTGTSQHDLVVDHPTLMSLPYATESPARVMRPNAVLPTTGKSCRFRVYRGSNFGIHRPITNDNASCLCSRGNSARALVPTGPCCRDDAWRR